MRMTTIATIAIMCLAVEASAQEEVDPVFAAMSAEMDRAMKGLKLDGARAPYRVDYSIIDTDIVEVRAAAGALTGSESERRRRLGVDVRVGDYKLDSDTRSFGGFGHRQVSVPIEDDEMALRRALWLKTDEAYKRALKSMSSKEAFLRNRPQDVDDPVSDYSTSGPHRVFRPPPALAVDRAAMEALARKLARILHRSPSLTSGGVVLTASRIRRRYLDTEGNRADSGQFQARLIVGAGATAEDGSGVGDAIDYLVPTFAQLPAEADLVEAVTALAARVEALRTAPLVEDYDGPVLFEREGAGQAMRSFLAMNVSGTPPPRSMMAYGDFKTAFSRKMNRPVMAKGWRVIDDPSLKQWMGSPLMGHYLVDHEGVPPVEVELVKNGHLSGMLMSRVPSKHQKMSNGHGRGPLFGNAAGHPGNLVITAPGGKSKAALRKKLLELANAEGYDYALVVQRLTDDTASVADIHSQHVPMNEGFPQPLRVIKIMKDGSEVPVRGAGFKHIIVRNLRQIVATSKDAVVYNYLSPGVASGSGAFSFGPDPALSVPTSIVTPSFILSHVEVVSSRGDSIKPRLVPRPGAEP
jgi:hypothetical protein